MHAAGRPGGRPIAPGRTAAALAAPSRPVPSRPAPARSPLHPVPLRRARRSACVSRSAHACRSGVPRRAGCRSRSRPRRFGSRTADVGRALSPHCDALSVGISVHRLWTAIPEPDRLWTERGSAAVETPTGMAAGVVLALFGGALLFWCACEVRLRHRLRRVGVPVPAQVVADGDAHGALDSAPLLAFATLPSVGGPQLAGLMTVGAGAVAKPSSPGHVGTRRCGARPGSASVRRCRWHTIPGARAGWC